VGGPPRGGSTPLNRILASDVSVGEDGEMREVLRNRRGASIFGCLMLAAVVTFAAAAPATTAPLRASFHNCGDIATLNSWGIAAKRVDCHKARRVVRAYNSAIGKRNGFTQDVLGFHCKVVGYYGDGGIHRCAASGHRIVRFQRGG
jgi:hypothetical protein